MFKKNYLFLIVSYLVLSLTIISDSAFSSYDAFLIQKISNSANKHITNNKYVNKDKIFESNIVKLSENQINDSSINLESNKNKLTNSYNSLLSFNQTKKLDLDNLKKNCLNKKVIIYTKRGCSFCKKMKSILNNNKILYTEIDVTDDKDMKLKLLRETSWKTFPYVFIENEFVGGYTDYKKKCSL